MEHSHGSDKNEVILGAGERSYWLRHLSCGQTYTIQMRAMNQEGTSGYSRVITANTLGGSKWFCCLILIMCHLFQSNSLILSVLKLLPHESDNLDGRIVTISCKRVHDATQARPVRRVVVRG